MKRPWRRLTACAALLVMAAAAVVSGTGTAATPTSGTVSPTSPSVSWTGSQLAGASLLATCATGGDPTCDVYDLTVQPPTDGSSYSVTIKAKPTNTADSIDFYVWDAAGTRYGPSSDPGTGVQTLTLDQPAAGVYEVDTFARAVAPGGSYTGSATLTVASGGGTTTSDPTDVRYNFDPAAPKATADATLRVVLVGFKPGEVSESQVLGQIPPVQRPGVLIPYGEPNGRNPDNCVIGLGADTLINHGRCTFNSAKPFLVPVEYHWKPQLIYAPDSFTDALFSAMASNSTRGDFSGATQRPYLEKYNTSRGIYRGANNIVQPGALVRFIDAEKTEDWLAANAKTYLGFDLGPKGGPNLGPGTNPGYTIFVLNTWDSPQADIRLNPAHEYHYFKINRTDPDTGAFAGIDWARVWGGRYRDMIYDLGAGPNAYESETWGNRRRTLFGSDAYDPPLWEYRATAPRPVVPGYLTDASTMQSPVEPGATWDKAALEWNLGRFADDAVSYRFLHSYLYEPRPSTGQYYLSSNIWHDKNAEAPWASDLSKLYNQSAVLSGLSTLVPYFSFTGDTRYEYLSDTSQPGYVDDQALLDKAKQDGGDPLAEIDGQPAGAVPFTAMNTNDAMTYLDGLKSRFERGTACTTTIPDLEVVVEKAYAWSLPLIVAGIATNQNGRPWGFLASVNDIFKTAKADRPDDILTAVHPDALGSGFTYTSIHELSHFLGLAHPHDTVGEWRDPSTGKSQYWQGFLWTFDSTAAPTTYAFDELHYSILDQETIARGHLAYYLQWADQALQDAGNAYYAAGKTTVGSLPAKARKLRAAALAARTQAQQLFAGFDFVKATFAAQSAWRAAAAYRDLALNLPAGTSELEKGTKLSGASSCPSASQ